MSLRSLLVGIGIVASLVSAPLASAGPMGSGSYLMELNGKNAGPLQATVGGAGAIEVRVGTGMSEDFYDWIDQAMRGHSASRKGAFVTLDAQRKEIGRRTFDDLSISRIVFPALDTSSKEPAALTVELAGATESATPKQAAVKAAIGPKQKAWHTSNFKFELGGLPPLRVTKIDALTWKVTQKKIPKVVLHLRAADAEALRAWKKAAQAKGASLAVREKQGKITYESVQGGYNFLLEVAGVTPGEIAMETLVIQNEGVQGARVELDVRSANFRAGPAAIGR
jgi:hypothetical protein